MSTLRQYYADPEYQETLREEITRRTQEEYEPIRDYLACLCGLFAKVTPVLDESLKMRMAHRNLPSQSRPTAKSSNQPGSERATGESLSKSTGF